MIGFQEYLINKGYEAKRASFNSKKELIYITSKECFIEENAFSTMISGGLTIEYRKGDLGISWGLGEYGKPPTLLYPRPKFTGNIKEITEQECTVRQLLKYTNDEIYEAIFNQNILLKI
jgi:hypothetical protein